MTTTNLGLPTLDGGDYISVDPFNTAFEALDKLGVDYVTESGTSGEWWWRKWKSGRAECGIDYKEFSQVKMVKWYANLFATEGVFEIGNYPIQFKQAPGCFAEFIADKAWSDRKAFIIKTSNGTATRAPGIRMVDPVNTGNAANCKLVISVWVAGQYA